MKKKTSNVSAVLFDLDDTLFDHQQSSIKALELLREKHKCFQSTTIEQLERNYFALLNELHPLVLDGKLTPDESRLQRFIRFFTQYGEKTSTEKAFTESEFYHESYLAARVPVPGATQLLEALKPIVKIGVVTNNLVSEQLSKLRACRFETLVDVLVVSEEVGVTKPAPEIFHIALNRLNVTAEEAVMVGDSWESDIVGAVNVGIRAIWFNRNGLTSPDPSLAVEINSFVPIGQVLKSIL